MHNQMSNKRLLWCMILISLYFTHSLKVELTNIKCLTHDPAFVEFAICYIKAVNRTYKYFSLRAVLHQLPINNSLVTFAFLKRANGYKPFLYNTTVSGCHFMKNRKKFKIVNYIYEFFASSSNINHSCPYNHDIIVDKLDINLIQKKIVLPVPLGEYCLHMIWRVSGAPRATVAAYVTVR